MRGEYLYKLRFLDHERELCAFEMRMLFKEELSGKVFFSDKRINPSISPFINERLHIMYSGISFEEILTKLERNFVSLNGFKVEYFKVQKDEPYLYMKRRICRDIGMRIIGFPSFDDTKITFGISFYNGIWYFGILVKNNALWRKHKKKPYQYSSSIDSVTAKVLVNAAGSGNLETRIIDPCCGVGTVLLEGCFNGYPMEGCEINPKVYIKAVKNIEYFGYGCRVIMGDIKDIQGKYDAAIVDVPYGNFCNAQKWNEINIIENTRRIAEKAVFISASPISSELSLLGFKVIDGCDIGKSRKGDNFIRHIYVCI